MRLPFSSCARLCQTAVRVIAFTCGCAVRRTSALVRLRSLESAQASNARALRLHLQGLGATFIKLGQLLAMRPDFLPPAYCAELTQLLDRVPPFPTPEAISIIEADAALPLRTIFRSFLEAPTASASFGQVYRAVLPTGEDVAVKVQRPGLRARVRVDLFALRTLAHIVDASTLLMSLKMSPVFDEFAKWTYDELDYRIEARYAAQMRARSPDDSTYVIPRVYREYSSRRVLVTEYLDGFWLSDVLRALRRNDHVYMSRLRAAGICLDTVSRNLVAALTHQVFYAGLFHADPHAANLVALPNGTIGFVDFGICGVMLEDFQRHMLRFVEELSNGSPSRAFGAISRVLEIPAHVDLRGFRSAYEQGLQDWLMATRDRTATLADKSVARLLLRNLGLMRRHGIRLPPAVMRYYRSLIIVDTMILQLSSSVDLPLEMGAALERLQRDKILETLNPAHYFNAFKDLHLLLGRLPRALYDWMDNQVDPEQFVRGVENRFVRFSARALRTFGTLSLVSALLLILLRLRGPLSDVVPDSIGWLPDVLGTAVTVLILCGLALRWLARRVLSTP